MFLFNSLLFLGYPVACLIVAGIITLVWYLLVIPGLGFLFDKLEYLEMRGIGKVFPARFTSFIANRVTFPGVILHESSHALMAVITGAKIIDISFFDIFKEGMLGHVSFLTRGGRIARSLQFTLVSCAPVLFGTGALFCLWFFVFPLCVKWWHFALLIYLTVSIVNHLSMSGADMELYRKGLVLTIIISFFVVFLFVFVLCYKLIVG